jgi:hypothetical protein
MIDINKEAEKYGFDKNGILSEQGQALIAGRNSKAAQVKVIQGQIDLMEKLKSKISIKSGYRDWVLQYKELQQQLKELEDE